ncbi:hypothetical protein MTO96_047326, partial [Rhipicephalus appendiculatus]
FLLLPAFLGSSNAEESCGGLSEILRLSEVYYRDFLRRCRNYGVTSFELPEAKDDDSPEEKPAASPKKSETESLLDACRGEYYTVLLKYWVNNAIEELRSIEEEKPILQYMAKMKAQGRPTHEASTQQQPKKPLRPIIITRNELQKQVYGAGYPSIPQHDGRRVLRKALPQAPRNRSPRVPKLSN